MKSKTTGVVIATHNKHKVREIRRILGRLPFKVWGLDKFPPPYTVSETGRTLEANALLKARAAVKRTGRIALADDTGLEVAALNGAPGVYSARFAGPGCSYDDNNRKLLKLMTSKKDRKAVFRCVVAAVFPGGNQKVFEGCCYGSITMEVRGKNGFGYDPVFLVRGKRKTFAELTLREKNKISHRFKAFARAKTFLTRFYRRHSE